MFGKDQVANKRNAGFLIGDDEIVVGMSGWLRGELKHAAAKINGVHFLDTRVGQHDFGAFKGLRTQRI